jgi:hypothetical protein
MAQIDLDTLPRSPKEAKALGLGRYFTGKPCPKGHVTWRYVNKKKGGGGGPCNLCVSSNSPDSWAAQNPEKRKRAQSAYDNSDKGQEARAAWAQDNRNHLRAYHEEWRTGNEEYKAKRREYFNDWRNDKMANDPRYKAIKSIRDRLYSCLRSRGQLKNNSTLALIGCSKAELVAHLEAQFLPGMSWENYSWETWHIDHIKPIATFEDPQDPTCWHYSNLRPRWADENIAAGVKLRWDLAKEKGARLAA